MESRSGNLGQIGKVTLLITDAPAMDIDDTSFFAAGTDHRRQINPGTDARYGNCETRSCKFIKGVRPFVE